MPHIQSSEGSLNYAIKDAPANNKQLIKKIPGSWLVPKREQSFTYDADGNMLSGGQWTFTWNGENRLVSTTKNTNDTKIEFAYDYQGRRFAKKVYSWTGSAWQLDATEKYVWDSYNRIAIFDGSNVLQRSLLYGEDINGGIGTAGGVGGLLAITDHIESKTCFPCFDGNGNVVAYTDAEGGCIAEYEYSPSPSIISKTGPKADELAAVASFSTMPYDKELDVFLYPMRVVKYGRFLSRDPKDEPGFITLTGINLNNGYEPEYVLVNNNIVDKWDYLGLFIKLDYGNHPVTWGQHHSKLWLITDEKDFIKKTKLVFNKDKKTGCKFISIGAGPTWNMGDLYASFNRSKDVNEPLNNSALVAKFKAADAIKLLKKIQLYNSNLNSNFVNTILEYELYPGASYTSWGDWNEYNSNSYISGLLVVLGYTPPGNGGVATAGYSKPVPKFIYTKRFQNTTQLKKEFKNHYPGF